VSTLPHLIAKTPVVYDKLHVSETDPPSAFDLDYHNTYSFRAWTDGKIIPPKYGSIKELDLDLCYETFFSDKDCRHGGRCQWRHAFFGRRSEVGSRVLVEKVLLTSWNMRGGRPTPLCAVPSISNAGSLLEGKSDLRTGAWNLGHKPYASHG